MKRLNAAFLFLVVLASALSVGFISREDDPLKELLKKLDEFRNLNPHEKVHLHTDKPYYSIGDTIWFKSYVVNAERNELSALSKIVYVDLINERDSIKKSLRIPLISGLGWGDFVLSDSLTEGNYRLRAYTAWMKNYGEEYFFDKNIQVGNALSNELITDVKYSYSKTGERENVTANITYQDIKGKPAANKEVAYTIHLDARKIASGKGKTDEHGQLEIKFANNQPFVLKSGKITTTLKLDEKTSVNKTFAVKSTSSEVDVQFFPESGQLVNGVRSKVGVKALGADGLSQEVSGVIIDKENNTVAEFATEHAGMGNFAIVPEKGNSYTALLKLKDGSEKRVPLPKAAEEGYALSVNGLDPEKLMIRISASSTLIDKGALTLIAQTNGVVYYVSKVKLSGPVLAASLPKNRFPTGILQLTLFSPAYQPVAERLTFVDHNTLNLEVKSNKSIYKKREKVDLSFFSSDSGKAVPGNFSVAVINESLIPYDDTKETTILSDLLLSSDLKGYIENPNYYFSSDNPARAKHLDNLLLTQGWRRFKWTEVLNKTYPSTVYAPEQNLRISGRVTTANDKPVAGGKVILLPAKGSGLIMDTITNADGRFSFENLNFNENTTFVLQARTAKDKKNVYIEIDHVPQQLVTKSKNAPGVEININQSMLPYLISREKDFETLRKNGLLKRNIILETVTIEEKKPTLSNSSNLNGAGNADAIIREDQLHNCITLADCLQGKVAGVIIQNGIAYSTRSMNSSFSGPVPMQLIIDGMYVEPDYLTMIQPQDVESIEILKSGGNTAIYGSRGGGGVLLINTKRGERNLSYRSAAPGLASYKPLGLHIARQFYSPVYPAPAERKAIPDLRNTVFWTPNILTDAKTGNAAVSFYTSDLSGTYKVVVEGLDFTGSLVRKVHRFEVK